jgi:hypothetical protein
MSIKTRQGKTKNVPIPGPYEDLKQEVASELDLMNEVQRVGWGGLSARVTGMIGGIISRRVVTNKDNERG